jgi:hypothetical protein
MAQAPIGARRQIIVAMTELTHHSLANGSLLAETTTCTDMYHEANISCQNSRPYTLARAKP